MNDDLHFVARKLTCSCAVVMKFMEILVSHGRSQGASQGGSSSARSVDLARLGVALPLLLITGLPFQRCISVYAVPKFCLVRKGQWSV